MLNCKLLADNYLNFSSARESLKLLKIIFFYSLILFGSKKCPPPNPYKNLGLVVKHIVLYHRRMVQDIEIPFMRIKLKIL